MKKSSNSILFLQLSLALMFISFGLVGIINYNSDLANFGRSVNKLFGQSNDVIPVLFAVLELVAGVLLIASLFSGVSSRVLSVSLLVIFIFWIVFIVMNYFLDGFGMNQYGREDFLGWLKNLSPQLVALSGLWIITRSRG
ncbi:MAG: hypothetical protein JXR86_07695 [Spirochaetales bacterium]|nr:hypothetical protein [Spirochaetales bacterium]